ncbi:MAG: 6-bladed beta-propeller [Algoriphagus aquaeductus]|uniref:6-bladed beta-propeller n=1 Tax=Algoriphagus aquaeductus TaxID=475299 RepID=UPI003919B855
MNKTVYLIGTLLLICCQTKKEEIITPSSNEYSINPTEGNKIPLSTIVDRVEVIQPNESEIIAYAGTPMVFEDKLIIVDSQKQKKIQVFNTEGDLLFAIQATGEEPKNFRTPTFVRINNNRDRLLVYCALTKKVLQFDWKGNFLEETQISEIGLIGDLIEKDNEIIFLNVMTVDSKKRIGKLNLLTYAEDKKITFFENYPGEFIRVLESKSHFFFPTKTKDEFYFLDIYSNNLVKMDWEGNHSIIRFIIENNPLILDPEKVHNPIDILDQIHLSDAFYLYNYINVGNNKILLPIIKGPSVHSTILLDTEKNNVEVISKFENGLDNFLPSEAIAAPGDIHSKTAIVSLDSDYAYGRIKSMDLDQNEFTKELKKLNTPENQNPVFIIYHLK